MSGWSGARVAVVRNPDTGINRIVWENGDPLRHDRPRPEPRPAPTPPPEEAPAVPDWPWWQPGPQTRRPPSVRAARPEPPAEDSAPTGEQLRRRRKRLGLSIRDLEQPGLSRGQIGDVERGRRRNVLSRHKLAAALDKLATAKEW